ncbi:glycerate kinase [Pseudomonas psychrotolerans L19]|uniref:glycerate kinase n=1 Tax=Pseudomonas TaxID=286 RepID=UPI00023A3025|nr:MULTISPECIES: glycerate kinase [Pseudomonas]EHK69844.1 glycerate kinase [Pseudomonas psychrotolerans L19]MBA1178941.1 glycerate kinase [Pseudomonas psychrotolerans]MBA1212419.1 glycerate kinase [Pseudomonas psychrotolerans]TCQ85343.1 glycerate kinase [Pseudomonas sp. JUb52]
MKIVIAPDSFKESLSAAGVASALARGLRQALPAAEIRECPLGDGGEGTLDAVLAATGGEVREARVTGPLGEPVTARWGWLAEQRTAFVEMASASGLELVPRARRDVRVATSHGTGELLRAALDAGAERLVLAIGGSATNDGGAGVLQALGVRLLDGQGQALAPGGAALSSLASLDVTGLHPRLAAVEVVIAADVDNPLCGPQGASQIFGPQKGASPEQVRELDAALAHFATVTAATLGRDVSEQPGAGAAGGVGFAALAFLQATFRPGIEVVAELVGLEEALQGADLAVTGEGRLDGQTLRGKTPAGVLRLAQRHGVPVVAVAGSLGEGYDALYQQGLAAAFSLVPGPLSLEEALAQAEGLLERTARDIGRLWQAAKG